MRTHEEFLAEGEALARAYCSAKDIGGDDPNALVEKSARDKGLNAEQIRRLGRATNVALFGVKYAAAAGQTDRRVEFPPVDPETVIAKLQAPEPEGPVKLAAEMYPSFPTAPGQEKVAEAVTEAPYVSPRVAWVERDNLWRICRDLPNEVGALQEKWASTLKPLIATCRGAYHDHLEFEKTAVAVLGEDVVEELNWLRDALKMPRLTAEREKFAEAREYLVGVPNASTEKLKVAMETREAYAVQSKVLEKAQAAWRAVAR